MFELDLGEMLDEVEARGSASGSQWEKGQYRMQALRTNHGTTQNGAKPKLGILWKALDGPYAGESEWENITLDRTNETSVDIFVNKLLSLGFSKEFLRSKPPMEQIAGMIEGVVALIDFSTKAWKSDATKFEKKFKVVKLLDSLDAAEESVESDTDSVFGGLGE